MNGNDRAPPKPAPDAMRESALDLAWEEINALGGVPEQNNSYDQGCVDTVGKALEIVEKLGGADPAPKRMRSYAPVPPPDGAAEVNELGSSERLGPHYDGTRPITSSSTESRAPREGLTAGETAPPSDDVRSALAAKFEDAWVWTRFASSGSVVETLSVRDQQYVAAALRSAPVSALAHPFIEVPLTILYKNHRGEVAPRNVFPVSVRFGTTKWHPEAQWLLKAFDRDKQAEREFAMRDISALAVGVAREAVARETRMQAEKVYNDIDDNTAWEAMHKVYFDAILALSPVPDATVSARDACEDRWQHVKLGTEYTVEGLARLRMSTPLVYHQMMVVYRSVDNGSRWVRSEAEFHDGRFRSLTGAKL